MDLLEKWLSLKVLVHDAPSLESNFSSVAMGKFLNDKIKLKAGYLFFSFSSNKLIFNVK